MYIQQVSLLDLSAVRGLFTLVDEINVDEINKDISRHFRFHQSLYSILGLSFKYKLAFR